MKNKRFSVEQIVSAIKQQEAGLQLMNVASIRGQKDLVKLKRHAYLDAKN